MNYEFMLGLAQEHGFASFTDLQELAFQAEDTYDYGRDLFVVGETSSGKTLIPMLLYDAALKDAVARGKDRPKMLFVVPYRALAAQKTEEMQRFFAGRDIGIVQSTGEFRQDDDLIQSAQVEVAVVITEKVYKYESRDPSFLSKYDYLVLDEIGLIKDADRGIRLDFIFAWAKNQKLRVNTPRIIALGTPFFDWSAYISSYDFSVIKADKRPVKLDEISLIYEKNGIRDVQGKCDFLHGVRRIGASEYLKMEQKYEIPGSPCEHLNGELCPFKTPCRSNPAMVCPEANAPCSMPVEFVSDEDKNILYHLLLQICRRHLLLGQQVLVFVNDRVKVMEFCAFLYDRLKEHLPSAPPAEECRKQLLAECGLESDDVFGIMENDLPESAHPEYYRAFLSGIGFHSAALPVELRTYVEKKFLESRDMRIVCSTETLAFGVNSSVDVVVIADLYKHEGSTIRALTLNEYQNYSGRAGRLRGTANFSGINGYVYTLINKKNQLSHWQEMRQGQSTPEKLYSLFHKDEGQMMPFFILNLLPTTGADSMTVQELIRTVRILPKDSSASEELLELKIKQALRFLRDNGLADQVHSSGRREENARYCLTGLGVRMRGYIIGRDDYERLVDTVSEYVTGVFLEPDKARFLYSLLCTKHAENGLKTIPYDEEAPLDIEQVRGYVRQYLSEDHDAEWLDSCQNIRLLFVLAALLAWGDGESPKYLFRQYGIHYALLNKLAEQISYLIEIAKEILPSRMELIYRERAAGFARMGISAVAYAEAVAQKQTRMQHLFMSVYYGINTRIVEELLAYLQNRGDDPDADRLAEEFSLQYISPLSARRLRRMVIRYKFFENPPQVDERDVEQRNNFRDQRTRYQHDIAAMGELIAAFFTEKFGSAFRD